MSDGEKIIYIIPVDSGEDSEESYQTLTPPPDSDTDTDTDYLDDLSSNSEDESVYNIPGGNDIERQFLEILNAMNYAYLSSDAFDPSKDVLRKLINRLILLDKRQRGERKAVKEGMMDQVTVDCYFGFSLPNWKPDRNASNADCRRWVSELLALLTPSP